MPYVEPDLAAFRQLARYNQWANRRLYAACAQLPEAEYLKKRPSFFGSIHATLNHILVADRVWMKRFTGAGEHPNKLNAILHRDLATLRAERETEDRHILAFAEALSQEKLEAQFTYTMMTRPDTITSKLWPDLLHVFNHQTHHRGQAHTGLSILTGEEPPSFDMLIYARAKV